MKLAELDPEFMRRHADGSMTVVQTPEEADGLFFLCPTCYQANGGRRGTHYILCWKPHVHPDVNPKPGRWKFSGTSVHDLTLSGPPDSILLSGPGCGAHFHIRNGEIQ